MQFSMISLQREVQVNMKVEELGYEGDVLGDEFYVVDEGKETLPGAQVCGHCLCLLCCFFDKHSTD